MDTPPEGRTAMGFWGTLGKIAGFGGAPFTGGASLALPLISAGTDIAGAIIGGKAAGKASQQQQAAVKQAQPQQAALYQQALQIAQQQAQQGQAALAPYASMGGQGLTALTSLLGVAAPPAASAPRLTTPGGPAANTLAGAPGMVLLRAPTGQTQAVPADQAAFFLARGATRV